MRTCENTSKLFAPLEKAIHHQFIPALTGREPCSQEERELLSLPARLGGLNITIPTAIADKEYTNSQTISEQLTTMIIDQNDTHTIPQLKSIKSTLHSQNRHLNKTKAQEVRELLPPPLKRAIDLAQEKGASIWLTALPLRDQGFNMNKGEFQDAMNIRYGWPLKNTPRHCICGKPFTIDHAMTCHHGGLPTIRHNAIRDLTANLLSEVCHDVEREPALQPLTGETLIPLSANRQDDARADIRTKGFWGRQQGAFLDVRVFHPNAQSYRNTSIPALYRKHEQLKKREYGDRVRQVEMAFFTPLVLATTGGMGKEATTFYQRLADLIATKNNANYSSTLAWIRCKLAFSLLRSAVMCIRGSRSKFHHVPDASIELGVTESRLSA